MSLSKDEPVEGPARIAARLRNAGWFNGYAAGIF
jgi:hypothetical protein